MKLDRTLANEIKKQANGDGSREAKFAFIRKVRDASKMMSSPDVMNGKFDEALKVYGRVRRHHRLDNWRFDWAVAVLDLWTNRTAHGVEDAYIDDGIHPTRICEYARNFIRLTTEE